MENIDISYFHLYYVILGILVFVTFEIIPLNAKFVIRNQPKRYTSPGTVHGPLWLPFLSSCVSVCTFSSLHITQGICIGDKAVVPPKIVGNTNIHSIKEGIIYINIGRICCCCISIVILFT